MEDVAAGLGMVMVLVSLLYSVFSPTMDHEKSLEESLRLESYQTVV